MAEKKKPVTTTAGTRRVQKFLLVWVDATIDEIKNKDSVKTISKLRQIANDVNTFTNVNECVDSITSDEEDQIFLISSGALGQIIVPIVHDMTQVNTIYIFCGDKSRHEEWTRQWSKIKGVFTNIKPMCEALKTLYQQCNQTSITLSVVAPSTNTINKKLDELDQSFMYTTILKEILLSIDFDQKHFQEFVSYCRKEFADNNHQLRNIDRFEREYRQHSPVWWYTYDSFLYPMLNRALRTMDFDMIIVFGFFLCDLLKQIAQLHSEQFSGDHHSNAFMVYRGQNLAKTDFDQLIAKQGGLLSFNHFLSTVADRHISLEFVRSSLQGSDNVGILFSMNIDPTVSSTPFANVSDASYFQGENEVLFSMNSVFRIGQIKLIDPSKRLWQVDLTLASDDDSQMRFFMDRVREETCPEENGWFRLGELLIKLGHFSKAEQVYDTLLQEISDESEKATIYHRLGHIKSEQGQFTDGIIFYEKALAIQQKILPLNHPDLARSYNSTGATYEQIGEYSKALSYQEKALVIQQQSLPPNHPDLAYSFHNIGSIYEKIGEYSKALSYQERALVIQQKTLPSNHPSLASSYTNIGLTHEQMGDYPRALSYQEKALEMKQKILPPIHPDLATSYNNIGSIYQKVGEYVGALSSQGKALIIFQKSLPEDHPLLATSYDIMGKTLNSMGDYPKALSAHEKALRIQQKILPSNHPHIAASRNNIGEVYVNMDNYSKALASFERALEIAQRSLPPNHPTLQLYKKNLEDTKKYYKK